MIIRLRYFFSQMDTAFEVRAASVHMRNDRAWRVLQALMEQCNHPEDKISSGKCACGREIGPQARPYTEETGVIFSVAELKHVQETREKLEGELNAARDEFKALQGDCPHPEDRKFFDSLEMGDQCGVCSLSYFEINKMRGCAVVE